MTHIHNCELLEMWCADPRVPIGFWEKPRKYSLIVNTDTSVTMAYCPFCGKNLYDSNISTSRRTRLCKHMLELTTNPESSVKYRPELNEYWILGFEDIKVRLFFCPLCGQELPLQKTNGLFYQKSESEVVKLKNIFANIKTIDHALEQFGQPDFDRKPIVDYVFWKGKRSSVNYGRALCYQHLAKTVDVHVMEADGKIIVKFYPKAKEGTDRKGGNADE